MSFQRFLNFLFQINIDDFIDRRKGILILDKIIQLTSASLSYGGLERKGYLGNFHYFMDLPDGQIHLFRNLCTCWFSPFFLEKAS